MWNSFKKIFLNFYRVGHAIHFCPSDGAAIGLFPAGGFPKQKKILNFKTKFNEFPKHILIIPVILKINFNCVGFNSIKNENYI